MKEDHHYPDLLSEFDPVETQEWLEKARKDLKGEEPLQKFAWEPDPGILVKPYYDQTDLENLPGLYPDHPAIYPDLSNPRFWENRMGIKVVDEKATHALAREALQAGADGLIFHWDKASSTTPDILLNHLSLPQTFVSFSAPAGGSELWHTLQQYCKAQNIEGSIRGAFYADNRDPDLLEKRAQIDSDEFKGIGIHCGAKTAAGYEELAHLLCEATFVMDKLTDRGHPPGNILKNIEFSLSVGTDFFVEMARIRALRILLYHLAKAYDVSSFTITDAAIYAISEKWIEEAYQPHGNMLKSTTAALAAIAGGCNALTVAPENPEDKLDRRIARNVSNILKDESYLGKAADPAAGSYFIENLTWQFVQQGWETFTAWEQKGGYENLLTMNLS